MKILHVISSVFKNGGGTSEVVPRLCRALVGEGATVTLAVADDSEISDAAKQAAEAGVKLLQYKAASYLVPLRFSPALKGDMPKLVSDADIVHLHGLWQAPCWYAAAECRRQKKPYVMMPHGFLEPERLKISKWKKRLIGSLVERKNLVKAAALVATSESESAGFKAYGLENSVHIMPIGLDWEKYVPKDETSRLKNGKRRLLYFSRITPVKGLDMLAEAWSKLSEHHGDWELVLAGPDDRGYTEKIKAEFERLSPDGSVKFLGPVYGEEKCKLLHSADAFVLPTRSENWSIAVAEAMASCVPVVCTKGAPWQCLEECGAGYWVDVSVEGIRKGLKEAMSLSDDERVAMGEHGRGWVSKNLGWDGIVKKMISFYEDVLRGVN